MEITEAAAALRMSRADGHDSFALAAASIAKSSGERTLREELFAGAAWRF